VTTLADEWDPKTNNDALIGLLGSGPFVLGLVGHGASLRHGDKDIVGLLGKKGRWGTDPRFYDLPTYVNSGTPISSFVEQVDRRDGLLDYRWLNHDLGEVDPLQTPAVALWQTETAKTLLRREGFGKDEITDLFYFHYKSPDLAGHAWNMINPEVRDVVGSVDAGIGELVQWLDENLRGRYVLVITADHGQTPLESGGWPISSTELIADINARFDSVVNDRGLVLESAPTSLFLNRGELATNDVSPDDIARFLTAYTIGANNPETTLRAGYRTEERIFAAVTPGRHLSTLMRCVKQGSSTSLVRR
jgi:hypothetical protein